MTWTNTTRPAVILLRYDLYRLSTLAHDMNFPGSLSFVMFIVFKKNYEKHEWKINIWNILGILNDNNLMTSILYIHVHICHQKDTFQCKANIKLTLIVNHLHVMIAVLSSFNMNS